MRSSVLPFFLGIMISLCSSVHGIRIAITDEKEQSHWACTTGNQVIASILLCDGSMDCSDGTDEIPEHCDGINLGGFDEERLHWYKPRQMAFNSDQYAHLKEFNLIPSSDFPRPGKTATSVDIYFLVASHSNLLLREWLSFTHQGVGFLLRDQKGRELGRTMVQYWAAGIPSFDIKPSLSNSGELQFDKDDGILFEKRAIVTFERSRGNWESGYWEGAQHLRSVGPQFYGDLLDFIGSWYRNHTQFMTLGLLDQEENIVVPPTSCVTLVEDVVQHVTGAHLSGFDLPQYGHFWWKFISLEMNASSARVRVLLGTNSTYRLAELPDLIGGSSFGLDPNSIVVVPVFYLPDHSPLEADDFVATVHIMRPPGFSIGDLFNMILELTPTAVRKTYQRMKMRLVVLLWMAAALLWLDRCGFPLHKYSNTISVMIIKCVLWCCWCTAFVLTVSVYTSVMAPRSRVLTSQALSTS